MLQKVTEKDSIRDALTVARLTTATDHRDCSRYQLRCGIHAVKGPIAVPEGSIDLLCFVHKLLLPVAKFCMMTIAFLRMQMSQTSNYIFLFLNFLQLSRFVESLLKLKIDLSFPRIRMSQHFKLHFLALEFPLNLTFCGKSFGNLELTTKNEICQRYTEDVQNAIIYLKL